jgi:hypothetical protein
MRTPLGHNIEMKNLAPAALVNCRYVVKTHVPSCFLRPNGYAKNVRRKFQEGRTGSGNS